MAVGFAGRGRRGVVGGGSGCVVGVAVRVGRRRVFGVAVAVGGRLDGAGGMPVIGRAFGVAVLVRGGVDDGRDRERGGDGRDGGDR